jgi:hypothetical protein
MKTMSEDETNKQEGLLQIHPRRHVHKLPPLRRHLSAHSHLTCRQGIALGDDVSPIRVAWHSERKCRGENRPADHLYVNISESQVP